MLTRSIVLSGMILVCGCAEPRPPTGGPRDETPPQLVSAEPAHESVNVPPTSQLKLTFSEYVNQASFVRALSITPAPQGRMRMRWRNRSVTIQFSEPLRDSTTYVATLNDEFRDWQGVRLTRPLSFAFATGPVIDQGRLYGRVIDPIKGKPVAGLPVLVFNPGEEVNGIPAYQTQTDSDGQFGLRNVRESDFFILGLQDANRNLRADDGEQFAVPPNPLIKATPDTIEQFLDWVYTKVDTLRPVIERVRATSNRLVEVRFSEKVALSDLSGESWAITDSVDNTPVTVHSSYQLDTDTRVVYLMTDALQERSYALLPDASVQDSSDNTVFIETIYFAGSTRMQQIEPRFERFLPTSTEDTYELAPWETPTVVFNRPLTPPILDSLVTVQDSTGTLVSFESPSSNGTSYNLLSLDDPAQVYRIAVSDPDSARVRYFKRLGPRELGSFSGIVTPPGDSVVVILTDSNGLVISTTHLDSTGAFMFGDLPQNTYQLRAFIDSNRNGIWDGGMIHPYVPAEPIAWMPEAATIRPRWDTELGDTLRIGTLSVDSVSFFDQ